MKSSLLILAIVSYLVIVSLIEDLRAMPKKKNARFSVVKRGSPRKPNKLKVTYEYLLYTFMLNNETLPTPSCTHIFIWQVEKRHQIKRIKKSCPACKIRNGMKQSCRMSAGLSFYIHSSKHMLNLELGRLFRFYCK